MSTLLKVFWPFHEGAAWPRHFDIEIDCIAAL